MNERILELAAEAGMSEDTKFFLEMLLLKVVVVALAALIWWSTQ